jgi:hypothetical protein
MVKVQKCSFGCGLNLKMLSVYKNATKQSNNSSREYVEWMNNS